MRKPFPDLETISPSTVKPPVSVPPVIGNASISSGVRLMSFEPSNETELIFLAVFSFVAVEALPDSSPEMPPTTVRSPVIVPPELSSFLATSLLIESIYFLILFL